MITSLREQLIRDEENRQFVYFDSVGAPTVGVGRNLRDKGLSALERDFLLDNDISDYTIQIFVAIPWADQLDTIRREVLVNMAFNLGIGLSGVNGLLGFPKFLAALQAKNYVLAAKEMLDSKWAKQVGSRAVRLSQQILLGIRQ